MKYTLLVFSALTLCAAVTSSAATTCVSMAGDGTVGNGSSFSASVSADGRYVAFGSIASSLVVGDTNNYSDIFLRDRQTGQTTRISVAGDGSQALYGSAYPSISADGRYVAFQSDAPNLVLGDTNGSTDIFVYERDTGTITRVSVASDGSEANERSQVPSISADGRYVAFASKATNLVPYAYPVRPVPIDEDMEIFVHDRIEGTTTRVSVGINGARPLGSSRNPSVSSDGRYVAFESFAPNFVPGDTNNAQDIFVYDRDTGVTTRVSLAGNGEQVTGHSEAASISADGRYVAFASDASSLVSGDTNNASDVFVHDRQTGMTTRVSLASDETQANSDSRVPSISADGRYVAFESRASNLVAGDIGYSDIFVRDRKAGTTKRLSVASDGTPANADSDSACINADGQFIAFQSWASNLVSGDLNGGTDVFLSDRGPANVSLTPASGSFIIGSKYTFTSRYSDPDGYADFANAYLLINNTLNSANAAFLRYDANAHKLYVRNDANTGWLGGYAPGSANIIENSYVRLYCAETSRSMAGDVLVVNWRISFKAAMSPRACRAWLLVYDDQGLKDSFKQKGAGIKISRPPSITSLSPTTGLFIAETKLTFTSKYSDPDGYGNLANCYLLVNSTLDQGYAAFVRYDVNADKLYVKSDDNGYWMGGTRPGDPGTIENSYVRVYCAETTRSGAGDTLTVNWKVAFKAGMSGRTCGAWLLAFDDQDFKAGWTQKASGIKIGQTPSNVSLLPNTGTLPRTGAYTLICTYSDPDGCSNLANCYLLLNTTLSQANAVFLRFDANTGLVYLKSDENTTWFGGVTPGGPYQVVNSRASLDCSGTSVFGSGDTLTINWRIAFQPGITWTTAKAWMLVYDDLGLRDGYDQVGTFAIQ